MSTYPSFYRRQATAAAIGLLAAGAAAQQSSEDATASAGEEPAGFRIVSPEWVEAHASSENVRVIDVRQDVRDYLRGHVPGAVHLHDEALTATRQGIPGVPAPVSRAAAIFGDVGLAPENDAVIYSDGDDVPSATFVAYALERLGHENVAIMDGGFAKYEASGLAVSKSVPAPDPVTYEASAARETAATIEDLAAIGENPDLEIFDVRPSDDYYGHSEVWERNGHLRGSRNLRWPLLMTDDNLHQFGDRTDNAVLIAKYDLDDDDSLIVVGATAREATLLYFYVKHIVGHRDARLLEGGWTEIASRSDIELINPKPPSIGR